MKALVAGLALLVVVQDDPQEPRPGVTPPDPQLVALADKCGRDVR